MKGEQVLKFFKQNKNKVILAVILVIGFLSRLLVIDSYPNALNVDEASSGYEAWSILNYGIDRNGKFLPIFLIAWGSGQNALYSYLMMPFIKILGLNMLSLRLPMSIVGCISLIVLYLLLKEIKDEKTALIGVAFFAICPWHIMKSRWGLESNLFPELVLLATYFMILSLKREKIGLFYLSSIILRNNRIFLCDGMFLFTIFCNTSFINITKEKMHQNEGGNYLFKYYYNRIFPNDIVYSNKYF